MKVIINVLLVTALSVSAWGLPHDMLSGNDSVTISQIDILEIIYFHVDSSRLHYVDTLPLILDLVNKSSDTVTFDSIRVKIDPSIKLSIKVFNNSLPISKIKVLPFQTAQITVFFTSGFAPDPIATLAFASILLHASSINYDSTFAVGANIDFYSLLPLSIRHFEDYTTDFKIFPNPSPFIGKIWCSIIRSELVHLHIFNELGKDIMSVYDGMLPEGKRDFSFKLPPGMYYVRMERAEGVVTKKVVVE